MLVEGAFLVEAAEDVEGDFPVGEDLVVGALLEEFGLVLGAGLEGGEFEVAFV